MAPPHHYEWTRKWAVGTSDLTEPPDRLAVLLLGSSGMGKSTWAKRHVRARPGARALVPLRQARTRGDLVAMLDEALEQVTGSESELYLDGLDEVTRGFESAPDVICTWFENRVGREPLPRVRVLCRTSEFPEAFESEFREAVGEEVVVCSLRPLELTEVCRVLDEAGHDADQFRTQITTSNLESLIGTPITCVQIIDEFVRTGAVASSGRSDALERAARALLSGRGHPSPEHGARWLIAQRLGAVSLLGRHARFTDSLEPEATSECVSIRKIAGGPPEPAENGDEVAVDEADLRAVLDGDLLVSEQRPYGRVWNWHHRSHQEVLTACYLRRRGVEPGLLMEVAARTGPASLEVLAFLCDNPRVRDVVLETKPLILLRSEALAEDDNIKPPVVEALLDHIEHRADFSTAYQMAVNESGPLAYPGLADQLGPRLASGDTDLRVRRCIIEIAAATKTTGLRAQLEDIAIGPAPEVLRAAAAHALEELGAPLETFERMLVRRAPEADQEVLATCLRLLWPARMTTARLVGFLEPEKRSDLIGDYRLFLEHRLPEQVGIEDVPLLLSWCAANVPADSWHRYDRLVDALLRHAANGLEREDVRDALAAWLGCEAGAANLMDRALVPDEHSLRWKMGLALLRAHATAWYSPQFLVADNGWFRPADIEGVLAHLDEVDASDGQDPLVAGLVAVAVALVEHTPAVFEPVLAASRRHTALAAAVEHLVDPVDLDSASAKGARETFRRLQQLEARSAAAKPPRASGADTLRKRLAAALDRFNQNNDAWWGPFYGLGANPDRPGGTEFAAALARLPGWPAVKAEPALEQRLRVAARRALEVGDPNVSHWLGKKLLHHPAVAGYRALQLVMDEHPDDPVLAPAMWKKWAAVVVGVPLEFKPQADSMRQEMLARVFEHAPEAATDALFTLLEEETDAAPGPTLHDVRHCIDAPLARRLLDWGLSHARPDRVLPDIVRSVVDRLDASALGEIWDEVVNEETAPSTWAALLDATRGEAFDFVWQRLEPELAARTDIARSIVVAWAERGEPSSIAGTIERNGPDMAAGFLEFLLACYPERLKAPLPQGSIGPLDRLQMDMWHITRALSEAGHADALEHVARSVGLEPELEEPIRRARARQEERGSGYPKLSVREVLALGGGRVFISYRRSDNETSQHAVVRLRDKLSSELHRSRVFLDQTEIPGGADWRDRIEQALRASRVLLMCVGNTWADRLHDEDDLVRWELERALELGVRIVPVRLTTSALPTEPSLPLSLQDRLFGLEAVDLTNFDRDVDDVVAEVRSQLTSAEAYGRQSDSRSHGIEIPGGRQAERGAALRSRGVEPHRTLGRGSARSMQSLFISYRRADSGEFARMLYGELRRRYGGHRVFMDTEQVRGGQRWAEVIDAALESSSLVIAIIGPKWTSLSREGRPRLHHEDDWVRREIAFALSRKGCLLPVLYSRSGHPSTTLPSPDALPSDLIALPAVQSFTVHQESTTRDLTPLFRRIDRDVWPLRTFAVLGAVAVIISLVVGSSFLPETRLLFRDQSGALRIPEPPAAAALWAPAGTPARGLVQSSPEGVLYVWEGKDLVPDLEVVRIEPARLEPLLQTHLDPDSVPCGTLLQRVVLARTLLFDHPRLSVACEHLETTCQPAMEAGGPEHASAFEDALGKGCPR